MTELENTPKDSCFDTALWLAFAAIVPLSCALFGWMLWIS